MENEIDYVQIYEELLGIKRKLAVWRNKDDEAQALYRKARQLENAMFDYIVENKPELTKMLICL